jgi:hypothetical protein
MAAFVSSDVRRMSTIVGQQLLTMPLRRASIGHANKR